MRAPPCHDIDVRISRAHFSVKSHRGDILILILVLFLTQKLTHLWLQNNQIGDTGAQHLAEALKTNKVSCFLG